MADDIRVQNEGTIFILYPLTTKADDWFEENLPEDCQMWGRGFVIEHRYVEDILMGAVADGLTIQN